MQFIDLKAQQAEILHKHISLRDDINRRINDVLDHGKYILGPEVLKLEKLLSSYISTDYCIGVSSGTDALLISLMSLGILPGDEIITTPFSFISTAETIIMLGAKPVFVDIDRETYNIDPEKVEDAITPKTKAIIPVSLYGQPANLTRINMIAEQYSLAVIEDGAQSFGSKHNGNYSCNLSTIGTTSFFPTKPLGCYGDGGACFTNNKELAERIQRVSKHGQARRYFHTDIGINGRLDTLQAAILISKLQLFSEEIRLRQLVANRYTKYLNQVGIYSTPHIAKGNTSVYAQYTIQVDNRYNFQKYLNDRKIPTAIHYPTLLCDQPAIKEYLLRFDLSYHNLKVASELCPRVISLPMHPWLKEHDQDQIIDVVAKAIHL